MDTQAINTHKGMVRKYCSSYKNRYSSPSRQTIVQPKLELTTPGDSYEREADRMADFVMRRQYTGIPTEMPSAASVVHPAISRSVSGSAGVAVDTATEGGINASRGGGQPMPEALRSQMESSFGADFSGVRLHTDSRAADLSRSIQAKAFAYGNDIYFNHGQYSPDTAAGQHLIAHELTHVVQQSGKVGREPDIQNNGGTKISLEDKYLSILIKNKKNNSIGKLMEYLYSDDKYNEDELKKLIENTKNGDINKLTTAYIEGKQIEYDGEDGKSKEFCNFLLRLREYWSMKQLIDETENDIIKKLIIYLCTNYEYNNNVSFMKNGKYKKNETSRKLIDCDVYTYEIISYLEKKDNPKTNIRKTLQEKANYRDTDGVPQEVFKSTPIQGQSITYYPIYFQNHMSLLFKIGEDWYVSDNNYIKKTQITEEDGVPNNINEALHIIEDLHPSTQLFFDEKYYYFNGNKFSLQIEYYRRIYRGSPEANLGERKKAIPNVE